MADLIAHDWNVVNLDRQPPAESAGCPFIRIDLTDYGQTVEALTGIQDRYDQLDALVHLAAIPAPGLTGNAATFANNATTSYNVFTAAKLADIKNVVWASSETVLGLPFDTPPPYLPVDEDYPPRPESTYSLVKALEEQMAAQLCRWDPQLKMIGLRFERDVPRGLPAFAASRTIRCRASGISGATSMPATAPRPSGGRWTMT